MNIISYNNKALGLVQKLTMRSICFFSIFCSISASFTLVRHASREPRVQIRVTSPREISRNADLNIKSLFMAFSVYEVKPTPGGGILLYKLYRLCAAVYPRERLRKRYKKKKPCKRDTAVSIPNRSNSKLAG